MRDTQFTQQSKQGTNKQCCSTEVKRHVLQSDCQAFNRGPISYYLCYCKSELTFWCFSFHICKTGIIIVFSLVLFSEFMNL